ncbi:MAG: rhomboid family intramembrane serine protease [Dehalococcoidia bacterium]
MIPVADFARRRTTPYVNWTLIAINVAVFIYMLTLNSSPSVEIGSLGIGSERDQFLFDYGFVAACVGRELGFSVNATPADLSVCPAGQGEFVQVFTSMFVHAGWAHIFGNMLFLWIFGDNVEDRMGHGRYLVFYLLCGIAAAALQTFLAINTVVPSVGASGAIAGVLGAYLILYPFVRVQVVILPFFFLPFFVPAALLIGIWFLMQLVAGVGELGEATAGSGVAWWAHVGGFVAGIVLIWFFKQPQRGWRQRSEFTG